MPWLSSSLSLTAWSGAPTGTPPAESPTRPLWWGKGPAELPQALPTPASREDTPALLDHRGAILGSQREHQDGVNGLVLLTPRLVSHILLGNISRPFGAVPCQAQQEPLENRRDPAQLHVLRITAAMSWEGCS